MSGILIIKLGAIGDVLRTTAILSGLKEKYSLPIIWVTKKEAADLLKNNSLIDEVYVFDNSIFEKLKKMKFELIISLDDEMEACSLAAGLDSKKITGAYQKGGKPGYTEDSSQWFDMGLISRFGKARADELKKLNRKTYQQHLYDVLKIKPGKIILRLGKKELDYAKQFANKNNIKKEGLVIGINTSAGKRWKQKSLSAEKTAEIADILAAELNAKILLFGGKGEKERNEKIRNISKTEIIDAGCDNSLPEFASLINLCGILVASDSLAMHIGTALGKKVVAFFGPTSAAEIELYGIGKKVVSKIECACCYKKECEKSPNCSDLITALEIADAVKSLTK